MNDYYKTCKFAKGGTKKHKKEQVSADTYAKVFEACKGKCALCGASNKPLQLHHILGRGKGLTDNYENCLMLCIDCHLNKVHGNLKHYRPILLELAKEIYKNGGI